MQVIVALFMGIIAIPVCLMFMPAIKTTTVGVTNTTAMAGSMLSAGIDLIWLTWPFWIIGAAVFGVVIAVMHK